MRKLSNKTLDRTHLGKVQDVSKNGYEDFATSLAEVLISVSKYHSAQKIKVLVSDIDHDETPPIRVEQEKIVALGTLMKWYKKDVRSAFSVEGAKEFLEKQKTEAHNRAMVEFKGKVDSGFSRPIK